MKRKSYSYLHYDDNSIPPETKYFDCAGSSAVANTGDWTGTEIGCDLCIGGDGTLASYTDCALIPSGNGTGYGQVSGSKYQILKIRVRGYFRIDATGGVANPPNPVSSRISLVMDKKAGGAQLQGEQVYTDWASVVELTVHSFQQQVQATNQYEVLKDMVNLHKVTAIASDGTSTTTNVWEPIPIALTYTPSEPLIVNILTTGATPSITQLKDINIFMLARAELTGTIQFVARCYYVDC